MSVKYLPDTAFSKRVVLALTGALVAGCQKKSPAPALAPTPFPEEGVPLSRLARPGRGGSGGAGGQRPVLIPHPKELTFRDSGHFVLHPETPLVIPGKLTPSDARALSALQEALAARLGRPLKTTTQMLPKALVFGGSPGPGTPQKPEGYLLEISPEQVVLQGRDGAGLYWAVQTLQQLFVGPTELASVHIRDWPTLALRAVHLFHGSRALPFHQKLIARILSPLKLNALFLEVEQIRWDADPAIAPAWAGTKAQLREELAFAREHNMTVYPLLQCLGHMGWLLGKGGNGRFAEDPATPYALCLSDPEAVRYIERFVAEADALFQAPAFHVGMDEVALKGRFPFRSRPKTAPDLFLKGVRHWHDFFAARGKPIYLWADMALHAPEVKPSFGTAPSSRQASAIRAGIPRDVVVADWQYGEHDAFPSLQQLKRAGFQELVAASWYRPKNIQMLSRAAAQVGAHGLIQTTWCGYESSEDVLATEEKRQFTAMVLAAEYFWNGGGPAPGELPFSPEAVFDQRWSA